VPRTRAPLAHVRRAAVLVGPPRHRHPSGIGGPGADTDRGAMLEFTHGQRLTSGAPLIRSLAQRSTRSPVLFRAAGGRGWGAKSARVVPIRAMPAGFPLALPRVGFSPPGPFGARYPHSPRLAQPRCMSSTETLGDLLDCGYRLHAHCSYCGHNAWVDVEDAASRLGRDFRAMAWTINPRLRCTACGASGRQRDRLGRELSIRLHPSTGFDSR